jgi:hypothetical protein
VLIFNREEVLQSLWKTHHEDDASPKFRKVDSYLSAWAKVFKSMCGSKSTSAVLLAEWFMLRLLYIKITGALHD